MQNRGIEVAQQKARNRSRGNHKGKWMQSSTAPILFQPPDIRHAAKFPSEIRPERRALGSNTAALIIASDPEPAAIVKPPNAPAAKRKARAGTGTKAKPRSKAKASAKVSAHKPRAKSAPTPGFPAQPQTQLAAAEPVPSIAALPNSAPIQPRHDPIPTHSETLSTPLPRSRAVVRHRKASLLDIVGYWLRVRASELAGLFKPHRKPAKRQPQIAAVLAENDALRREIARLRSLQKEDALT